VPRPKTAPNRCRVVGAITEHTVRPPPRSPAFAVQGWDRIYQGRGLLRVVPVRTRQTHSEGYAAPVADHMTLAPALRSVGGIGPRQIATMHRPHGAAIEDGPRPIDLAIASEPIQQRKVDQIPHAGPLPVAQAPPARHPRPAPEFLRQHLPRNATPKDEDNAGETRAIREAWPSTLRSWR
jgi:hypothetical protein